MQAKKIIVWTQAIPQGLVCKMDGFLLSIGFTRCKSDPNVYLQKNDVNLQVIVIYFDDIIIIGCCTNSIGQIKNSLHNEFAMTNLGLLRKFLGLEIEQNGKGIMLSQPHYASNLLNNFNMVDCKASKSPFLSGIKLHEFGNSPMVDITLYRKLVGSLLYLTQTRPDFPYVVSVVEIHMHQPHEIHWKDSKIILQYVQGTKKLRVHYTASSSFELAGFSDSY